MNDLCRMTDRMNRAEAEANPVKSLKILMGWTCGTCGKTSTRAMPGRCSGSA